MEVSTKLYYLPQGKFDMMLLENIVKLFDKFFRIIIALDLELWYLRSLKFVIALKFLGPKLFMLQNMVRNSFSRESHLMTQDNFLAP